MMWTNPLSDAVIVDVVVDNPNGAAASRTLDMFSVSTLGEGASPFAYYTAHGSTPNQADAGDGVITVGAISSGDSGHDDIESFSDQGPTNDGRMKPDISGIDCVSVSGAGGFPNDFCGTSAAAPHVAGIAALLLECNASLRSSNAGDDRDRLRAALMDNAIDLGPGGPDNVFGAGRADAMASANATCDVSTPSPTPTATPTETNTPTPTVVHTATPTPVTSGPPEGPTATPSSTPEGAQFVWGDGDCNGSIGPRDGQATLKSVLEQNALTQTEPCPDVGSTVSVDGADVTWGDVDCNGSVGPRDGQATLKNVLEQNALTQTQPCPAIGSIVTVNGGG